MSYERGPRGGRPARGGGGTGPKGRGTPRGQGHTHDPHAIEGHLGVELGHHVLPPVKGLGVGEVGEGSGSRPHLEGSPEGRPAPAPHSPTWVWGLHRRAVSVRGTAVKTHPRPHFQTRPEAPASALLGASPAAPRPVPPWLWARPETGGVDSAGRPLGGPGNCREVPGWTRRVPRPHPGSAEVVPGLGQAPSDASGPRQRTQGPSLPVVTPPLCSEQLPVPTAWDPRFLSPRPQPPLYLPNQRLPGLVGDEDPPPQTLVVGPVAPGGPGTADGGVLG